MGIFRNIWHCKIKGDGKLNKASNGDSCCHYHDLDFGHSPTSRTRSAGNSNDEQELKITKSSETPYGSGLFTFGYNGGTIGGVYHTENGKVVSVWMGKLSQHDNGGWIGENLSVKVFGEESKNKSLGFWNKVDKLANEASNIVTSAAFAGFYVEKRIIGNSFATAERAFEMAYSKGFRVANRVNSILGATGKILGVTSLIASGANLISDPSLTNLTKVGINIGTLFLKANPIGLAVSLGVGVLDYTGYLDKGLNYIYNEKSNK